VACKNLERGEEAEADCAVACTACGRCAADAPEGLIAIRDNLALVDYSKNTLASSLAVERCPTGAIVWLDDAAGPRRGREAVKIVRKGALPLAGEQRPGARPRA
jgi:ferredoxin